MNFLICNNCGKEVPEGNFCDQCGSPISNSNIERTIVIRQVKGGDACLILRPNTLIGRTQGHYIEQLKDYKFISGKHAHISFTEKDGWTVTDIGSTNGTYVNDDRLIKDIPHKFAKGDIIDFGTMIFEVL